MADDHNVMRPPEIIAAVVALALLVGLIRGQYGRVTADVTNPDPDGFEFRATTPIVRPLCPDGGSDCLIMPTPDFDFDD